jgi:hypothetical protein
MKNYANNYYEMNPFYRKNKRWRFLGILLVRLAEDWVLFSPLEA